MLLFVIFKGIGQWRKNENSPRLSVPVLVVSKRTSVRGDNAHTSYYVTFEFESGDRAEFLIAGKEYALLAEADKGVLTFQGSRFLGFERYKEFNNGL